MRLLFLATACLVLTLFPYTVSFAKTDKEKRVCSALLDQSNISWQYNNRAGDEYSVNIPAGFSEPEWSVFYNKYALDIRSAEFDFTNGGKPSSVYAVSFEGLHSHYYHYIVAASDEEEILRDRLSQVSDGNDLSQLEADLIYASDGNFKATANGDYLKNKKVSPMKSVLYDASNTKEYDGWYTRSTILLHDEKTYVVAYSNGFPSIAIFKPKEDGRFEHLCSHNGIASREEDIVTPIGSSAYPCPSSLEEKSIKWSLKREAIVDLPEWEGKRPVKEDLLASGSMGGAITKIYVGAVDASSVDKEKNWQPLLALEEGGYDTVGLKLTDKGPYLWVYSDDPTGDSPALTTYYRIDKNALVPVCSTVSKIIPPPGYANTKSGKTGN